MLFNEIPVPSNINLYYSSSIEISPYFSINAFIKFKYSMKVSVVIPAYNEEEYIKKCLESVMDQEVPAYQVIVVNNNSRDKTAKIARVIPCSLH